MMLNTWMLKSLMKKKMSKLMAPLRGHYFFLLESNDSGLGEESFDPYVNHMVCVICKIQEMTRSENYVIRGNMSMFAERM